MKTVKLNSDQIITLNDYPVYSQDTLNEYFISCRQGKELPLVPVIPVEIVNRYFEDELLREFNKFKHSPNNQSAGYFMLDGSHRTTALTLAGRKIRAIIYEQNEDLAGAGELVAIGQLLKNEILQCTLEENCKLLSRHFSVRPHFMTVQQKTDD